MWDSTPALILILVAFSAGATAVGVAVYLLRLQRGRRELSDEAESADTFETAGKGAGGSAAEEGAASGKARRQNEAKAHSLFVIFSAPDAAQRQAVVEWLRALEARYDPVLEVYTVAGKQPANPVKVANAFLPGTLPDLLAGQGDDDFELRGVSLLVKPPLRRRRNQQMHVFVQLARELEAMGGEVLDGDREPATDETYAKIIGE